MSENPTADERLHPRCAGCLAQTQCLLFSKIPVHVLSCIQTVVQVRWCPRANTIFREGEPAKGFFIVRSGWARLFTTRPQGRQSVHGIAGPGHVLGLVEVLSGSPIRFSAQALGECELEYVDAVLFSEIVNRHPQLRADLLEATGRHFVDSRDELLDFVRAAASVR